MVQNLPPPSPTRFQRFRLPQLRQWSARVAISSFTLLVLLLAALTPALAQSIANYTPTRTTGISYSSISGTGTSFTGWRNGNSTDDNLSGSTPIGFPFIYNGAAYTQFSVSTNGYLTFNVGTAALGSGTGVYGYQNTQFSTASGTVLALAPFYDDQQTAGNLGTLADLNASFKYQTTGTTPNRVLTAEWINVQDFSGTSTSSFNYQVKLYEVDSHIEYVYGTMTLSNSGTVTTMSYSLGINSLAGGATAANLLTLQTANTNTFSSTASNALGGATPANMPATNSQYTFTPIATIPAVPTTLTFSPVSYTTMTVNFVDNSTTETGFAVLISTDGGVTYSVGGNLTSTTTAGTGAAKAVALTGLTGGTTYTVKVLAVTEGRYSTGLTGSQATLTPIVFNGTTYTIDNANPTAGTNFNTFAEAFAALNAGSVTANTVFNVVKNVAPATYNEAPLTLTQTGTSGATITFQSQVGNASNPIIQGTTGTGSTDAIIQLAGSDYVTFDAINLTDNAANVTGTTKMERGLWLNAPSGTNGCQNNTYKNGVITLDKTNANTTVGVYTFSSASVAGGANSSNSFLNNTVQNATQGYQFNGSSTALDQSNVINTSGGGTSTITNLGGTGANPTGVQLNAQNLMTIANTTISSITATAGITAYGISNLVTASTNLTISGNTITGLTSASGGTLGVGGIVFSVASTGTISGNTLTSFSTTAVSSILYGISSSSSTSKFDITQNQLNNFTQTNAGAGGVLYGIDFATPSGQTVNISRNYLHTFTKSNTSGIVYGIRLNSGSTAVGTVANISNNLIANLTANAASGGTPDVRAFHIATGNVVNVYYNTVHLSGTATNANETSAAFYATTGPSAGGIDFRNNIFSNKITGGLRNVGIYRTSTAVTTLATTSNNNLVYGTTALYYDGTNTETTMAGYRTRLGGGRESAAVTESTTPFISATNPHLNTAAGTQAEAGAAAIGGVTDDYDATGIRTGYPLGGQANGGGQAPDMGADEGDFIPVDLTPPTITYTTLGSTASTTNRTLVTTITDLSGIATGGNAPRIYYRKNAGAYVNANATTVVGPTYTFTIDYTAVGGVVATDVITYYVAAQDLAGTPNVATNPAGGSGTTPPGTTAPGSPNSYTILNALNGTYYVTASVGSSPNPAKEYLSLTAAVAAYNTSGLTGAVTFELFDNGTYAGETYPITINANADASATNTLTIKPSTGKTVTLSGASGASTALLVLNGADYVTLDGSNSGGTSRDLSLTNTTAGTTAVIWVESQGAGLGATNNVVKNVNLTSGVDPSVSTTVTFGIFAGGTSIAIATGGADNDNNRYQNNFIQKVRYGIASVGVSSANPNQSTIITTNLVGPTAFGSNEIGKGGIVVTNEQNPQITANEVRFVGLIGSQSAGGSDRVGIALGPDASWSGNSATTAGYVTGATVSGNKIHDIVEEKTFSAAGIVVVGADGANATNNRVFNNFIYGVRANGTTGDQGVGIGISAGNGDQVAYNSISMTGDLDPATASGAATASSAGVSIVSTNSSNLTLKNNSVYVDFNSNTGTLLHLNVMIPTAYAWGTGGADYNDLYYPANAQMRTGGVGLSSGPPTVSLTLANWQAATSQEANSIQADPLYASSTDLHAQSLSPLNAAGNPVGGITTDIDGATRNVTTPDIGADEFTPLAIDLKAIGLATPTTSGCYTATETVSVTVQNVGTATLNFAANNATVTAMVSLPGGGSTMLTGTLNSGTLAASATQVVVLTPTLDMSPAGTYSFALTGTVVGDLNTGNDLLTPDVTRTATQPVQAITIPTASCVGTPFNIVVANTSGSAATLSGSNATAQAIPDNSLTGISSTIALSGAGSVNISASSTVTVTLNVTHAFASDLDIFLIDPSGTRALELTTNNGGTGSNFTNTVLTTAAGPANITTVVTADAPFTGTYRTEGATIFAAPDLTDAPPGGAGTYVGTVPAAALNGAAINGTWTLRVFDDTNADLGTLNNWNLSISDPNIPRHTVVVTGPGTISAVAYSGVNNSTGTVTVSAAPAGSNVYTIATTDGAGCTTTTTRTVTTTSTLTWNGSASTNWYTAANWTPACVPSSTLSAVIPTASTVVIASGTGAVNDLDIQGTATLTINGTGNLDVTGTFTTAGSGSFTATSGTTNFVGSGAQPVPAGSYNNLTLTGATAKVLTGDVTLAGDLDLTAGMLRLDNFDLTLADNQTITGFSNTHFVVEDGTGVLTYQSVGGGETVVFPIGTTTAANDYTPAKLTNNGTSDDFTGTVNNTIPQGPIVQPGGPHVVGKTWDISEAVAGGSNATLVLGWNTANEGAFFDRTLSAVSHFVGGVWDHPWIGWGPAVAGTFGSTWERGRASLTSFSPFAMQDANMPLPVTLTTFQAERQDKNTLLTWETASERNSKGFEVQVSTAQNRGAASWRALGFVASETPTSNTARRYTFTDAESGKAGVRYYRLKQVDLDGTVSYSATRTVTFGAVSEPTVAVWPNPFAGEVTLELAAVAAGPVELTLTDALGRTVWQQTTAVTAGVQQLPLALPASLRTGAYVLSVTVDGQALRRSLIKQ